MFFRYQCRSVAFSLNGWRDASLINKNRFFFPQMDLREWFSVDLRLVKQSRRWHLFMLHLFTIFVALDKSYCVGGIQVQQQPEQSWRNLEMGDSWRPRRDEILDCNCGVVLLFVCSSCLSFFSIFSVKICYTGGRVGGGVDRDWLGESQFGKGWMQSLILLQCNVNVLWMLNNRW